MGIMRILALDQSFTSTGFSIFDKDKSLISFGLLKNDKSIEDIFEKALTIALKVCKLIEENEITQVNMEGLAFGMTGNSTRDLAGLQFAIITMVKHSYPLITVKIIAPKSVKKFATGSGKASKQEMIDSLPEDIKKQFTDKNYKKTTGLADITDSYYIGLCPT
jgi:Holliday junction resolvasome RuvABC endonuclease subunit